MNSSSHSSLLGGMEMGNFGGSTRTSEDGIPQESLSLARQQQAEQAAQADNVGKENDIHKARWLAPFKKSWKWIKHKFDDKPYEVKEGWGATTWHLVMPLLTTAILTGAIVLGAVGQSFSITDRTIWRQFQLNQDAQLAAFGILNTLLAHMNRHSLDHISTTTITRWMVSRGGSGATILDFEMGEELGKPWTAAINCHSRRKSNGWRWRDGLRFVLALIVGSCLLLQGAAMNTVAIPKARWWPDSRFVNPADDDRFFFTNRTMRVACVSRMSVWGQSWNMLYEGGDVSWDVAHVMAAKSIFDDLSLMHGTAQKAPGWQFVHDEQVLIHNIVNVTSTSSASFQAVALDGQATGEMWDEQRTSSSNAWARRAIGWDATFKLTGILLDTTCSEASGNSAGAWNASSRDNGTIFLDIGSSDSLDQDFPGASCSLSVKQVLFVIQQWIVENEFDAQRPDYSPNGYGSTPFSQVDDVPSSAANVDIANELADWFNAVAPSLQSLFPNPQTANFTSIAMRLSNAVVELGHGHTPMDGLAMVVAFIFSNMLTTFDWTFEQVPGTTTRQGPVRWQIYGSGPRLQWQWAIAIVIGVNIVVQLYDIFLILWHRHAKGMWLSLGGMLFAANAAGSMAVVKPDQGAGFIPDSKKDARFFIRQTNDSEGDEMRAVMISDRDEDRLKAFELLDSKKSYGKVDPVDDDSECGKKAFEAGAQAGLTRELEWC